MEIWPDRDAIQVRKILCALDLGPQSRAVFRWAAAVAQTYSADLAILHAVPTEMASLGEYYFDPQWRQQQTKAAFEHIVYLKRTCAPVATRRCWSEIRRPLFAMQRGK
jgi:hypothetical protein